MAWYEDKVLIDMVDELLPKLNDGTYMINEDNTITYAPQLGIDFRTPWVFAKHEEERQCGLWMKCYFNIYKIIPEGCHKCWKIVVSMNTVDEAIRLSTLQRKLGYPGKTGMEVRSYTSGLFSAFWYCPLEEGLEGAREHFNKIKPHVQAELGEDVNIILKHACTEMELVFGPSDEWVRGEQQVRMEALLDSVFVRPKKLKQPPLIRNHVYANWIRYARQNGDMTYKKYIDIPIVAPLLTYHDSDHKVEDFIMPERKKDEPSLIIEA